MPLCSQERFAIGLRSWLAFESRRRRVYHRCEASYIINSEGIAYHQNEVLYIIKPQIYTLRVMIYAFGDDIHADA